jgi:hypothetical protein
VIVHVAPGVDTTHSGAWILTFLADTGLLGVTVAVRRAFRAAIWRISNHILLALANGHAIHNPANAVRSTGALVTHWRWWWHRVGLLEITLSEWISLHIFRTHTSRHMAGHFANGMLTTKANTRVHTLVF